MSEKNVPGQRIESLDWLRGFLALSVMVFHFSKWTQGEGGAESVLARLGIYAVSAFYVLSGLSLSMVYFTRLADRRSIVGFYIKRLFRILPLLSLATGLEILRIWLIGDGRLPSVKYTLLNMTGLFGFVMPNGYIATGAWSIGNELVFYVLFPLFVYCYGRSNRFGNAVGILPTGVAVLYSFYLLSPSTSLGDQWDTFINPLNQFFLFYCGIWIYANFKDVAVGNLSCLALVAIGTLAFIGYPAAGDTIVLAQGLPRFLFAAICVAIVLGFWKASVRLPAVVAGFMDTMGAATYSIYLLHPIVGSFLKAGLIRAGAFNVVLWLVLASVGSIVAGILSFRYLETPLINLGKTVSKRIESLV